MNKNSKGAGSWPTGIFAITLFVEDLPTAKQFYSCVRLASRL